jgi:GNAT-family acetyltransferase (TIGR03103 family)
MILLLREWVRVGVVTKGEPVDSEPGGYQELNSHTRIIVDEAVARDIEVEIVDPATGELCLRLGDRRVTTLESLSELTSAVAFRRCDDKLLTRRVLEDAKLPVAPGREATFDDADRAFLRRYHDLVVKPARGEQGRGITVGVTTPQGLRRARNYARRHWPEVLLEQRCHGEDLRVVVIAGEMVAAAVRRPPVVTGTGTETVAELIDAYNRHRSTSIGANSVVPLDDDVTRDTLRAAGFPDPNQVVPAGVAVTVRGTANVHTGGTITDVTDDLHPDLAQLAVSATLAVDLPVAGVDLIVDALDGPTGVIIEVNEQPGLANHEPRPTAARFVDLLFPETRRSA